ncbi:hypothetical protein ACSBR2_001154 [Camellia fascicularis]
MNSDSPGEVLALMGPSDGALLHLPNTLSPEQKKERAMNVITELGLERDSDRSAPSSTKNLKVSCSTMLTLAYQSLGVVYGDLSTSSLYVYKTTFSGRLSLHEDDEEIYGVFSFIFWTFTVIALFKYIILREESTKIYHF